MFIKRLAAGRYQWDSSWKFHAIVEKRGGMWEAVGYDNTEGPNAPRSKFLGRRGFEVHRPTFPISGTDLLILLGNTYIRCEVKATTESFGSVRLSCSRYNSGIVNAPYEQGLVDLFFLVDLSEERIFILPSKDLKGKPEYTLSPTGDIWIYLDRYDLIGL